MSQDEHSLAAADAAFIQNPNWFRLKTGLLMLLGCVLFGGVLGVSLLCLLAVTALLLSGKLWIILIKLIKVVWVLVMPLWGVLRLSWRALFSRTPELTGHRVSREEAPKLWAELDRMRQALKGPAIHALMLVEDNNAYAHTRPVTGFWFVPLRRRTIAIGVPLLQTLSEKEALAVIAHEYGHHTGHPNAFDAWVYRLRWLLVELYGETEKWTDWPSRMLARLLRWYIPLFSNASFALCRAAEYAADRAGVSLVGAQHSANALMRSRVAGVCLGEHFWPKVYANAESSLTPNVRPWLQLPQIMRAAQADTTPADTMRRAFNEATDDWDTHPALNDRLSAMGVKIDRENLGSFEVTPVAAHTAAETWFGDKIDAILAPFDDAWKNRVADWWKNRHEELLALAQRRAELERAAPNDVHAAWDLLGMRVNADEVSDVDAAIEAFIATHPDFGPAHLTHARRIADSDVFAAAAAARRAARLDADCAASAGQFLSELAGHLDHDETQADYAQRHYERLAARYAKDSA